MIHNETQKPLIVDVSHECLLHLKTEFEALCRLEQALLEVKAALRSGNTGRLAAAANHQDRLSAELSEIHSQRQDLRQAIAAVTQVGSDEATIGQLVAQCPEPMRSRLAECRSQVADVALRIDRLMQSNLIVVVHGMQLMEQIWMALTGDGAAGASYESTGKLGAPLRRAVFQTRC